MNWIEELERDISTLKTTVKELKKFGLLIGGILILLAIAALWNEWWDSALVYFIFGTGSGMLLMGIFFPKQLHFVYRYWMIVAFILGSIVSRVILAILFYLVITPVSLIAKMFGKKFFVSYGNKTATTYWIRREKPINYDRMS